MAANNEPIVKIFEKVVQKDKPFVLKMSQKVQTDKQEHEKYDSQELFENLEVSKKSLLELEEKFLQLAEDLEE